MSFPSDQKRFISKKAYEIAYAVFRILSYAKIESFKSRAEDMSLSLLEFIAKEEFGQIEKTSKVLEFILRFGADVGAVNSANVQAISEEIKSLNAAVAELENKGGSPDVPEIDLGNIFATHRQPKTTPNLSMVARENDNGNGSSGVEPEISTNGQNGNHGVVKSAMRQSAILERIRQNGNCRLREIQELLPDVSERTLRYDVQNLLNSGLIERVGNGGPATHYKTRDLPQ